MFKKTTINKTTVFLLIVAFLFAVAYIANEAQIRVTEAMEITLPPGEPEEHKDIDIKAEGVKDSGDRVPQVSQYDIGMEIAEYAKRFYGVPYTMGGSSPETGFDCSGFVNYVLNATGHYTSARTCTALYYSSTWVSFEELLPGDIVFFTGTFGDAEVTHVGIYIGGNRMIHAGQEGEVISDVNLWEDYWVWHLYGYGRIR